MKRKEGKSVQPIAGPSKAPQTGHNIAPSYRRDFKGKGRDISEAFDSETSFDRLLSPDGSISLVRVEAYIAVYCKDSVDTLLNLVIWILQQKVPPNNDIANRKRRFRVYLYRRAEVDQKQRETRSRAWNEDIDSSTDILCTEILIKEVKDRCNTKGHIDLLRRISKSAFRGKASRTLQAIGRLISSQDWKSIFGDIAEISIALLEMQDYCVTSCAQSGQWNTLWDQRGAITSLAREQAKYDVLRKGTNSDLQLDIVLLKAFLSASLGLSSSTRDYKIDSSTHDLASTADHNTQQTSFVEGVEHLYNQTSEIYGQCSDRWLGNLVLGVTSRIDLNEAGLRDTAFGAERYREHESAYNLVRRFFTLHCERSPGIRPSKTILDPMIALELKMMQHCKLWQETDGRNGKDLPSDKHLLHIQELSAWLIHPEEKNQKDGLIQEKPSGESESLNDAFFDQLEMKARSVHIEVRLASMTQAWRQSLSKMNDLLDGIQPDERYHEHVNVNIIDSKGKQAKCAQATMNTRRLVRGALINILVQVTSSNSTLSLQDCAEAIPLLLSTIQKSIRQGFWDSWALRDADTRRNLKHFNVKALMIDPPSELARLLSKLVSAMCPVRAIEKNSVTQGFNVVQEGVTAPIYWKILASLAETIQLAETRADHLVKERLTSKSNTYPTERPYARIFSSEGATPARGIWSAFVNIEEKDRDKVILFRLRILLNDLYLPLKLPPSAWKAARLALAQVCSPSHSLADGRKRPLGDQAWALFNVAEKKGLGRMHIPKVEVEGEEFNHARMKVINKNKVWRETQWKKKRYPEQ